MLRHWLNTVQNKCISLSYCVTYYLNYYYTSIILCHHHRISLDLIRLLLSNHFFSFLTISRTSQWDEFRVCNILQSPPPSPFLTPNINTPIFVTFSSWHTRVATVECLIEIASLPPAEIPENYQGTLKMLLTGFIQQLQVGAVE